MKKIKTVKYAPWLNNPASMRTLTIDMNKVVAIDGPFTTWRSSNSGYIYYSTLYVHTDVPDLKFTITVDDPEPLLSALVNEVPKCELYLREILSELMSKWNDTPT